MPHPIDKVVESILTNKPDVLFAPHVETTIGILLTEEYIKKVADAMHQVGGIFVLDGIAAGNHWVDMQELGIDVYVSAPQKGWSGPCFGGFVLLNENTRK